MKPESYLLVEAGHSPTEKDWLLAQSCPVIAVGERPTEQADVQVADEAAAQSLIASIAKRPQASLVLVQVLRAVPGLSIESAMTLESMAYAVLQSGSEYLSWLEARAEPPQLIRGGDGPAILLERNAHCLSARLNRPQTRNAITVEMRDALAEALELLLSDVEIPVLELSGEGACFSVGGELREFGLVPSPAEGHWIRTVRNPSRLMAKAAARVRCHLHSACVGSGIEIPAFAGYIEARPKTFFQLPELDFGLIPGAGGTVSISRRIGRQRAAWLALSGRKINAERALEWGLIDAIAES